MFSDNMHETCHMEQHTLLSWVWARPWKGSFSEETTDLFCSFAAITMNILLWMFRVDQVSAGIEILKYGKCLQIFLLLTNLNIVIQVH